jgi:outer membrane immunogenic protein
MKKLLLASVAALTLAAVAGSASAADLGRPVYKAPAAVAPMFSWTGFYVGVQGGWGQADDDFGGSADGGFVGGTLGYNYQVGNWVFGIEGDGAWADIGNDSTVTVGGVPVTGSAKVNSLFSLRGRVGFAAPNNMLIYGTAGGGWAHTEVSATALGVTASTDTTNSGWTAGAGVEWAFAPAWSAKVEYLHYGLDSSDFNVGGVAIPSGNIDIDTVKFGLNYRFGGPY